MPGELSDNTGIYLNRLHPCCALIPNAPLFRDIAEQVGLSCARMLYADHDEYLDTFELMTRVMRAHGRRHVIADDKLIIHAFAVSYPDESSRLIPAKGQRRERWLTTMRASV
ncbi:hypothetical protein [Phytoactinopolyspora mesophila]|uniref:Uncharacterized protein n=1 Tax=Phytoactinopolyspora mesophila TaxID=2650750 RepID=A0A7K3M6B9_9ACTN|nr:hypothetical protein [Phytoactinopolyspora mesophila]NDL58864.1 hypothetical protein [Phytoactinopolyspora mesophila]